ncbi:MAG: snare Ykt6 [Benniella sp.]|nr:MAG: snare Ykt6 [Benniella sp.]
MKLYAIFIIYKNATIAEARDLSSFGFFQRSSVGEFMTFMAQTLASKTKDGVRQSVEESNYLGHVYSRGGGLSGVVVSDNEYLPRVAFSLLNKVLDEFTTKYPSNTKWVSGQCPYPELQQYLNHYEDAISKVQNELDETKIILHKTIEAVLERGERMESLVERSDVLSAQSKMFYKTAKKQNSCCIIF